MQKRQYSVTQERRREACDLQKLCHLQNQRCIQPESDTPPRISIFNNGYELVEIRAVCHKHPIVTGGKISQNYTLDTTYDVIDVHRKDPWHTDG